MLARAFDLIFGCRHIRRSWPLSRIGKRRVPVYSTCLDCGREIPGGLPVVEPAAVRVGELQEEI